MLRDRLNDRRTSFVIIIGVAVIARSAYQQSAIVLSIYL